MFSSEVKKRVMQILNSKIEEAQVKHDEHCKMLDEKLEKDKAEHLDSVIDSFIKKFV